MCIFQSGKDIPPLVRISLRTLQYLVIPLLSLAILVVGSLHLGQCEAQPNLPIWHIVAGASGLITPVFYLLFDEINPWLSKRISWLSEWSDNAVVFLLPVYICFEVAWLITGTVWVVGTPGVEDPQRCDHTIYIFSYVVVINFWIHVATPLVFMFGLCCTRLFPYCAYCAYWNLVKKAVDNWTRKARLSICFLIAFPLGISMIVAGGLSVNACTQAENLNRSAQFENFVNSSDTNNLTLSDSRISLIEESQIEMVHIPIWLLVAGCAVLLVVPVYYIYDVYCKADLGGPLVRNISNCVVIGFLLCGLVWAVVGFLWVFGSHQNETCGADSHTYQFAFGTLIILNIIMDVWICYKICIVLYWAFLSED